MSSSSPGKKPFCWVPHWGRWRWGSFWIFAFWHILDWNILQAYGKSKDLLCILLEQCKQQAVGWSFGISLLGSSSAVGQCGHCNTAWETNQAGLRLFFLTVRVLLSSLQQCLSSSLMLPSDAFSCSPSSPWYILSRTPLISQKAVCHLPLVIL